jgi:hypothetical protein
MTPFALPPEPLAIDGTMPLEFAADSPLPPEERVIGVIPEGRYSPWSSVLTSPPSYYTVSLDPFFSPFGNSSASSDYLLRRTGHDCGAGREGHGNPAVHSRLRARTGAAPCLHAELIRRRVRHR